MPTLRQRIANLLSPSTEQRAAFTPGFASWSPAFSANVDPCLAENLSTVTACVNAVASGIASLPAYVYRVQGDGRVEAPQHPVSRLIRQPNAWQTWPDFIEMMMGQVLLFGNAIAVVEHDGSGRPTSLTPIPWQAVQLTLLPSGQLAYDVIAYRSPFGGTGTPKRYLQAEVLHLRDRGDSPYIGRSRISRAPEVIGAASGLQTFSTAIWANAATPSGAIKLKGPLNPSEAKALRANLNENVAGAWNAKKLLILDNAAEFQAISVSPEDAEVLASRKFSVEEICRLFQVPPPLVQDYEHNTFTNSAQASLWFSQFSLAPWIRKIEAAFQRSVFADPNYQLEIDMSGLTRGDYATRWAANVAAVGAGILSADEVREAEGYGPLAGAQPTATAPVLA